MRPRLPVSEVARLNLSQKDRTASVAQMERSKIRGGIDGLWQSRITRSLSSGRPLRAGPVGSIQATYLNAREKIAFCESFPRSLIDFQLRSYRVSNPLRSDVSRQQRRRFNDLQRLTSPRFTTAFDNHRRMVLKEKSRSPRDAYRRQAVRWSGCGARGRICSLLPGGLGISLPAL
jgi:hypothetical protein